VTAIMDFSSCQAWSWMTDGPEANFSREEFQMNTEIIVHPKLQHYGMTTSNLDAMLDWYRKVLGMIVNHRSEVRGGAQRGPFSAAAFVSNYEVNHRIVFFEMSGLLPDPGKPRHARVQHVAFEYESLDDLLGTYARLKGLGILPALAADQGVQMVLYYTDPDQNIVELNVNNYGNEWTATEHVRTSPSMAQMVHFDAGKMIAAREEGASHWDLHERALAGEFGPTTPYDPRKLL
ncbi:MAG: VOC family protein, partial [Rhodomicrobium sp.]